MSENRLFSLGFLRDFHDKDKFFEHLTDDRGRFVKIANLSAVLIATSAAYGAVMGSYNGIPQAISAAIKVPMLFALALLICFCPFFIIQFALGSKLKFGQIFTLILSGFMITSLIMVSCAPIVVFFLITGDNYPFLKLLHVAIFALSGLFGMKTVLDALQFSCEKKAVYPKVGVHVFRLWIIILAFVAMQLAWNLRPFVGSRALPFQVFRQRESNFYVAVAGSLTELIDPPRGNNNPADPNAPAQEPNSGP